MAGAAGDGGWAELVRPARRSALAMLSLGIGLYALNSFVVTTALPTAAIEIGGVALISWAFSGYLLAAIAAGVAAVRLGRALGTRRMLVVGGLLMLLGVLAAAAAPSMPALLAARVIQGLGQGVIAALCYGLIPRLFPPGLAAKVFGVEAIVYTVAAGAGPVLAGVLAEQLSWRLAFLVGAPLAVGFLALVLWRLPADAAAPAEERRGWLPAGAASLRSGVGSGLATVFLMTVAQASVPVYLVLALQLVWGYPPALAGFVAALLALSWSGAALALASLRRPPDPRLLIKVGPALLALGLAGLAASLQLDLPLLAPVCQIAMGIGLGLCWAPLNRAVAEAAAAADRDSAAALVPTVQSAGFAAGAALAGQVAGFAGLSDTPDAAATRFAAGCVFAAAALIAGFACVTGRRIAAKAS